MQGFVCLLAVCSAIISMTACAPTSSTSVVRRGSHELGRVGITSPAVQPSTDIAGLPPRGTAEGALVGTAAGSVVGAFECLIFLYPFVPAYPICMAVIAAAGTGAGISAAEPREVVDSAQEKFSSVWAERDWQALLRQDVVKLASDQYLLNVANLGTLHLLADEINTAGTVPAQTLQAETGNRTHTAVINLPVPADTLLEVTLLKLSTWFSGEHKFGFVLTGRAQLVRSSDLVVLTSTIHYYVSPSLPLTEWTDRDGILIGETVTAGVDYLAGEMVRGHLHAP